MILKHLSAPYLALVAPKAVLAHSRPNEANTLMRMGLDVLQLPPEGSFLLVLHCPGARHQEFGPEPQKSS